MIKRLVILLLLVNNTQALYFRKEQIVNADVITSVKKTTHGLRNFEFESAIKVETSEGNTYIITTNKEDGIKITDGIEAEWKIENKINLRGYKTIEKIITENVVYDKNYIQKSKNDITNYLRGKLEE